MGISERVLEELRALGQRHGLQRVILFGSRARGDCSRASDIDLALSGGNQTMFRLDAEEETHTLLTFDFVNLDGKLSQPMRDSISREGIVIYEKV